MKLTVKTLKGRHFEIRVQPFDTIMAVKKNIEDVQGKDNYPCGQQLLIHNGKVLKDESTLVENKITEDGFLVVMLSKPASTTQPTSNPTPTSEAPVQEPDLNSNSSASNVPAANAPSGTYGQAANLADGNNLEETIQQIMDIGGGNWDKETPMLQELGKQNPQLLSLIQEHHAEFLQLINEPLEGSEGNLFDQPGEMPLAVSVTPAEQEAIERLEAMGFDRALAIEAFFACDRNEELAINYLLENAGDYED
ncbi:hypothetical protein TEA_009542 [Camellia sinensis var. sinensis]|uniref:Ubiquitin receptor RAD23 n=1 Tax=Camellia sinensis var. sinensis TaxID=542762 RepID=A0A4S4D168_CAMSN|nr:hypothetical protein TEA_009542 [Camellia sinensis var. sinensis]